MLRVLVRPRAGVAAVPDRRRLRFLRPAFSQLESRELLAAGPLGLNVDFSTPDTFVNWLQLPGQWNDLPGDSTAIVLNASNDPESDASLLFDYRVNQPWNGPDPNAVGPNLSGTYHLSFNGQATIQPEYPGFSTPFTVQNQTYNAATNTTTADLVVPAGNSAEFFGIDFINTQATPTSGVNIGFSNARLIAPGYPANSTQLFTNQFLAALSPFSTLVYLDVDGGNSQNFFNGNTLVTVGASQVDQTGDPWEYLITLANQTNTDMWINVPEGATDGQVSIYMKNQLIGKVTNVTPSSTIDLGDVQLTAGLNTVSLYVDRGANDPGQSNPSYYQFQPTALTLTSVSAIAPVTASFVGTDTATQGNWKGTYGTTGFDLSQDPSSNNPTLPSYATVSTSGNLNFTWTASTSDPRALQTSASSSTNRIEAAWYSLTSFSINLTLSDNQSHNLALYAADWDSYGGGRSEQIQLISPSTGAVLDTRTLSNFQNGEYLVWNVTGSVTIVVTNVNPNSNALVDGLFLS